MRTESLIALWLAGWFLVGAASGAQAASLESLVMPGPVVEAHAETEENCSACHDLFDRTAQSKLCLECHEEVAEDLKAGTGFHGRDPAASAGDCRSCHSEHKGRDADIVGLQPSLFDHSQTDFPLSGAHAAESCASCHEPDTPHADTPSACSGCHEADDVHDTLLGNDCAECHDSTAWRPARFDHDTTAFPLTGRHADTTCLACHDDHRFEAPGSECIDCHQLDDVHDGMNGTACGDCHDTDGWSARFDHERETGFALIGAHAMLSCRNCHVSEAGYEGLTTDCDGCHNGDDVHLGQNGPGCGDCHGQSSWEVSFDHLAKTGYALVGSHAPLACASCHTEGLDVPLPVDCIGCHEADDPHEGGLEACADCHAEEQWHEDLRFHHDFTRFALVGLHRVASCEQCHDTLKFSPVAQDCTSCHTADDIHEGAMGEQCETCHNPAGWPYWTFDHDRETSFALTGAHEALACAACHPAGRPAASQSRACVACHRSDDAHNGGFGQNCDRCHLATSFEELKDEF